MNNRLLFISAFVLGLAVVAGAFLATALPSAPAPVAPAVTALVLVNGTPQSANGPIKIGVVQPTWSTAQVPAQALNADVRGVSTLDQQLYVRSLGELSQTGDNVIIAVGDQFSDATMQTAASLPLIHFLGLGQHYPKNSRQPTNLVALRLPSDRIGFLAGALAALQTRDHTIGAVLGPAAAPDVAHLTDGFLAGAQYIDPSINALIENDPQDLPRGDEDPTWGQQAGQRLITQGADILFAAGGTTANGALRAAVAQNVVAISGERDLTSHADLRDVLLASVIYDLQAPTLLTDARAARAGRLGANATVDVRLVGLNQNRPQVSTAVRARIESISSGLQDGSITTSVE